MRQHLFILTISLFSSFIGHGQIKINANNLPKANDIFKLIINKNATINIGDEGVDKIWDFSALNGGILRNQKFRKTSKNSSFNSDFKSNTNGTISYYKRGDFGINEVARQGYDPFLGIYTGLVIYKQPRLIRPTNIIYNNFINYIYKYEVAISKDQFPDSIIIKLPFVNDSIKFFIQVRKEIKVDAWGKLILQESHSYDVLRMKEQTFYSSKLYYKSYNKWIYINPKQLGAFGERMKGYTTIDYHYLNNKSKEPIAILHCDEENSVINVTYKDITSSLILPKSNNGKKDIFFHPNPSFGILKAVFLNTPKGNYTIQVSNIIGTRLWEKSYQVEKNAIFEENFTRFGKGPYLYTVIGPDGDRILSRKFTILKP